MVNKLQPTDQDINDLQEKVGSLLLLFTIQYNTFYQFSHRGFSESIYM